MNRRNYYGEYDHADYDHGDYGHHRSRGSVVSMGLMAAATAAAAIAVTYFLFGTEEGTRVRRKVRVAVRDLRARTEDRAQEMKESGRDTMQGMKRIGGEVGRTYFEVGDLLKERAGDIKDMSREESEALIHRIRDHFEEIEDDVEQTVKHAKKKATMR